MDVFTERELDALDDALYQFQKYWTIFQEASVHLNNPSTFSLPHQHAMAHYQLHIENFGAPSSLCTSTSEAKHKSTVKQPWCWSSCCEALKQILLMNERNDKLASAYIDFKQHGMLEGTATADALCRLLTLLGHNHLPPNPPPVPPTPLQSHSPEDDDDDISSPDDDAILSEVTLTKGHGTWYSIMSKYSGIWHLNQPHTTLGQLMHLANTSINTIFRIWSGSSFIFKTILTTMKTQERSLLQSVHTYLMSPMYQYSIQLKLHSLLQATPQVDMGCTMKLSGQHHNGLEARSLVPIVTVSLCLHPEMRQT